MAETNSLPDDQAAVKYRPPVHFTVTQIRSAASCPRILYFDSQHTLAHKLAAPRVTRIWETSYNNTEEKVVVAGGALFHESIERFNRVARDAVDVHKVIAEGESATELQQGLLRYYNLKCLDRPALANKEADTVRAFTSCVHGYMKELADIIVYAQSNGHSNADIIGQLFGDRRKYVDVTFHVGPRHEAVHITGRLDYVFYDWRVKNHRIIDYKLTPSDHPNNDFFQVVTYALMHHHQHKTEPDVAVFYLHPERRIVTLSWSEVYALRHRVYDLLASMAEWVRFRTKPPQGFRPPGVVTYCDHCPWNRNGLCEKRLGPKDRGDRYPAGWSEQASTGRVAEPQIDVAEPSEVVDSHANQPPKPTITAKRQDAPATPKPPGNKSRSSKELPSGLVVGQIDNEFAALDPTALNTHVAVVGAAGSGKSWLAKVIAEEAVRNGVPVLAVDPQGDLVQFLRQNGSDEIEPDLRGLYDEFVGKVEPRIFTPGSSHATRICLSPIKLPSTADLAHIDREERRTEELENILSTTASNLVSLANIGGSTDSQRTFLFKVLQSLSMTSASSEVGLGDIVSCLMAPDSVGIDNSDMILKKLEREKLSRSLYNFVQGPAAGLFTKGVQLDLAALIRPSKSGRVPLNVIYLNAMTSDEEKQFFVAMLAAEIYRWMVTSVNSTGKTNLLFYIDEARDFIPAGGSKPPAKDPLIRLFTQGRKYGVGCLLCTQSPRSVDYNVFGNCSTKIIGRMEAAQDVDRISDWFTTDGPVPPWIKTRKGADRGTFVARWPSMPPQLEGRILTSRKLFSVHEGAWSPDRLEAEMIAKRQMEN